MQATQTFRIRVIQVDDSLPVLHIGNLAVAEGGDLIFSEFNLKATDNDTEVAIQSSASCSTLYSQAYFVA